MKRRTIGRHFIAIPPSGDLALCGSGYRGVSASVARRGRYAGGCRGKARIHKAIDPRFPLGSPQQRYLLASQQGDERQD